ncbi:MAG: sodium:solute symporter [Phycisphaerae bacterium]
MAIRTKKHTRSVADFLAAGRSAGRYIITVSEGAAALGAITVVATYEKFYQAGFSAQWWDIPNLSTGFVIALTGWVIYRFRQTRAMTMAQFFEMRYSRNFRIFAGVLAFVAGLINFGIFPAVGARFFIYFCGLPHTFVAFGITVSTFVVTMLLLIGVSLIFTFVGGQIAVIVTDFIQGMFCFAAFLVIFVVLANQFSWTQISEAMAMAPADASLVNPTRMSKIDGFDTYFFMIAIFGAFYMTMAWQGTSGYNCSARTPHEARMAKVLGKWREIVQGMLILFMPICAYTFLHHPDFAERASAAQRVIATIDSEQIQKQMTVPITLSAILPKGVMGVLCAVMLAAFISTHDTYLHSWGSIFIQDIVIPFRKKPFKPDQHLRMLRYSTCLVAVFIFFFSLFFKQTEYILMFFAITGAIYLGGAGSVIVGGLYWKRGTTTAAWCSMITGSILAVAGIVIRQVDPDFAFDGQRLFFFAMVSAIVVYVVVSLLSAQPGVDLDRILRRGRFAVAADHKKGLPAAGVGSLAITSEFSRADKFVYTSFVCWIVGWLVVFLVATLYFWQRDVADASWLWFWKYYLYLAFCMGTITVIWFAIGGFRDLRAMFHTLATASRDDSDDGSVESLSDESMEN